MFLRFVLLYLLIGFIVACYALYIMWDDIQEAFLEHEDINKPTSIAATLVFHMLAWPHTLYHFTKGVWFGGEK